MLGIDVKSSDELKEIINQHKALKTQEAAWLQERETLTTELNTVRGKVVIEDPELYRLAVLKKDNPEDYKLLSKVVMGTPDPLELLKMDFIKRNPSYADDPVFVDEYVRKDARYKDYFDEDISQDSFEYKAAKLKFDEAAAQVKDSLLQKFNSIELPTAPAAAEEINQEEATKAVATSWQPKFQEIYNIFDKVPVMVPDAADPTKSVEFMSYELPADERAAIANEVAEFIISTRMPLTDENVSLVRETMRDRAIIRNLPKMIANILDTVTKENNDNWRNFVTNPSRNPAPGNPGQKPTASKNIMNQIDKDFPELA